MDERWEYKILYVSAVRWTGTGLPTDFNEEFDRLGSDGWELVGTQGIIRPTLFRSAQTVGLVAFFKRRVRG
jgi:hypothetical protein